MTAVGGSRDRFRGFQDICKLPMKVDAPPCTGVRIGLPSGQVPSLSLCQSLVYVGRIEPDRKRSRSHCAWVPDGCHPLEGACQVGNASPEPGPVFPHNLEISYWPHPAVVEAVELR